MLETFGFTNFVEICLINAMSPFDACDHLCSWEWVYTESRQGCRGAELETVNKLRGE